MAGKQHRWVPLFKLLLQAAIVGWLSLTPAAAQEAGPTAVIEQLNAALLEVMRQADELGYEGRYRQLAPVLEASYDFPFMTQIAAGTSWRDMTAQQRDELVALFTEMSIANYAARFDGYGGEAFEVLGETPGPRDAVVVESRLVRPDDKPVGLNYVMRDHAGSWRIVDVLLDAKYSELARQKAEFAAVLQGGDVADLETLLREKIADLAGEAGS
ncbi:MAG TPA: ABC transporter substrate-binding protein [Geminicoccaceae bacterium]|nr:ABC transporter substrate-binding protein [Geminicoccaceae bacterium]